MIRYAISMLLAAAFIRVFYLATVRRKALPVDGTRMSERWVRRQS